jgi:hypothetical protein
LKKSMNEDVENGRTKMSRLFRLSLKMQNTAGENFATFCTLKTSINSLINSNELIN